MNRNDRGWQATRSAERVVREHGIRTLPVDPIAIARSCDIEVKAMSSTAQGVSGMLLRVGNTFAIAYATHIDNVGFQNFSVAHELGHYYLPGHIDAILTNEGTHKSHAGFLSNDRYEMEADHFAAGLLMPRTLFTDAMRTAGDGLQAIEKLAAVCRTSLTATAIRYTQCSEDPLAIVLSTADKVDFCFLSEPLKEAKLPWIRKGQRLSKNTATFAFNRNGQRVLRAERDEDASDLQNWFDCDLSLPITEEIVGLGRYGKTLTVLTSPDLAQQLQDLQEDEDLRESWRPKFEI